MMRISTRPAFIAIVGVIVAVDAIGAQEKLAYLPAAPKESRLDSPAEDFTRVQEIHFQDPAIGFSQGAIVKQIEKINALNAEKPDHFMEVLLQNRPDLKGLPVVLGQASRLNQSEREQFATAVLNVRQSLREQSGRNAFWSKHVKPIHNPAAVAALMQIIPVETALAPGLIEHLARSETKEATQALARLAVFSPEPWARRHALAALERRDTSAATDILLYGLRYPWPAVVKQSADAVVRLRRTDLLSQLGKMLTQPDPRAPVVCDSDGRHVTVVRELVRVNHLRNCLLCHPPATTPGHRFEQQQLATNPATGSPLLGAVPDPKQPSPAWSETQPVALNFAVRADVTYLRQDFSLLQPVAGSGAAMQRFDFLVRQRVLTDEEAQAYDRELSKRDSGGDYHRTIGNALHELSRQRWAGWTVLACAAGMLLPGLFIVCRRRPERRPAPKLLQNRLITFSASEGGPPCLPNEPV